MEITEWDIQEVKRLKKRRLVYHNLFMLLILVLSVFYVENGGSIPVLFGIYCVLIWIITVKMLYTLMTGKEIGSKASRRVHDFDRDYQGEKRWKRRNMAETIFVSALSVGVTFFVLVVDLTTARVDFPLDAIPFIGAWIGSNVGEMVRIKKLKGQEVPVGDNYHHGT
ncbi:hypothetical protein [Thalassobacillus devorans]|uniref:hypothetical protein n=1 Tax=Thalassobacillus devorans TaxID=279813 RepID=UPI0020CAB83F|nr:hypothetical protein [Thalassobacillus devorans]